MILKFLERRWDLKVVLLLSTAVAWTCTGNHESAQRPKKVETVEAQRDTKMGKPPMVTGIEVSSGPQEVLRGTGFAPRLKLAFRLSDGSLKPVEPLAISYVPFRNNAALMDTHHRLLLASADGALRVLAEQTAAPPVQGPNGELVYTVCHPSGVDVHVVDKRGSNRIVATHLGSVGLLAPREDGRLFFIGTARGGGVAGLWMIDSSGPKCLTNCKLTTGTDWKEQFIPLPRDADSIQVFVDRVMWEASDGTSHSLIFESADKAEESDSTEPVLSTTRMEGAL